MIWCQNLSTNMTKIDNVIRKVRLILFMIEGEESWSCSIQHAYYILLQAILYMLVLGRNIKIDTQNLSEQA